MRSLPSLQKKGKWYHASGCDFYGLIADGRTDITTAEQFSCCLQYVDNDLETHCEFLRTAQTLLQRLLICLKDILVRLNIPIAHLRGNCFDGATNMPGCLSGIQTRVKEVSSH